VAPRIAVSLSFVVGITAQDDPTSSTADGTSTIGTSTSTAAANDQSRARLVVLAWTSSTRLCTPMRR
jgi:hypothetical protein